MTSNNDRNRPLAAMLAIVVMASFWLPTVSSPAHADSGAASQTAVSLVAGVQPTAVVM